MNFVIQNPRQLSNKGLLLAESVNTKLLGVTGRLLISKLPFPRRDFQQYDMPELAISGIQWFCSDPISLMAQLPGPERLRKILKH